MQVELTVLNNYGSLLSNSDFLVQSGEDPEPIAQQCPLKRLGESWHDVKTPSDLDPAPVPKEERIDAQKTVAQKDSTSNGLRWIVPIHYIPMGLIQSWRHHVDTQYMKVGGIGVQSSSQDSAMCTSRPATPMYRASVKPTIHATYPSLAQNINARYSVNAKNVKAEDSGNIKHEIVGDVNYQDYSSAIDLPGNSSNNMMRIYRRVSWLHLGKNHPEALAESESLASVVLPPIDPSLEIRVPLELAEKGILSNPQLESIIYSARTFGQTLADDRIKGFFLGDGTGCGKVGLRLWWESLTECLCSA